VGSISFWALALLPLENKVVKNQLIQTKMMKNRFQIILTAKYVELKAKIKQSTKKKVEKK
jgi:hypothetical protein